MSEAEELRERFKFVCKKCGSDNVVLTLEEGIDYGGQTGYQSDTLAMGCNDCKDNDFWMTL